MRIRTMVITATLTIVGPWSPIARAHDEAEQAKAARAVLDAFHARDAERSTRKLHVIYFTPMDREPAADWQPRVQRVMEHIRAFFACEMQRLGLGPHTIALDQDKNDKLTIHFVRGKRPSAAYDTKSGGAIRDEAKPILAAKGIKIDQETILIFCNLTTYDGKSIRHNSPYYAGGSARSGTGWLCDSPLLDPLLLLKTEPIVVDGQYGRLSIGRYNSIFIGGTAHELGHALGLPHNRENADQRVRGTSLMGSGNHTYGQELRGEGKGSFLPLADGLRLAAHPMFSGSQKSLTTPVKTSFRDLKFTPADKAFRVAGRIESSLPCHAIVAYLDPAGGGDYDAHTATAIPDAAGRFTLECRDLVKNKAAELRIVACMVNGATHQQKFPYRVKADGQPDLDEIRLQSALTPVIAAWKSGDRETLRKAIDQATAGLPRDDNVAVWSARLAETVGKQPRLPAPAKMPAEVKDASLSDCATSKQQVGWLQPHRNHVPTDEFFLTVAGQRHARGLYAHAPSLYQWELGGKWKAVQGQAGVQDGNAGTVVFVIRGDGKELWRSPLTKSGAAVAFDVSIVGVTQLDLIVEDGGDGRASDWAVWLDPRLRR